LPAPDGIALSPDGRTLRAAIWSSRPVPWAATLRVRSRAGTSATTCGGCRSANGAQGSA